MGLNTTHGCFDGPYSSFNNFRISLANQIGINLFDYKGYGSFNGKNLHDIGHELMPLFNHSDCSGYLSVEQSKSIVKGLDKVLKNFNDNLVFDYYFKEQIKNFKNGCLLAISKNEVIYFN